MNKLRILPLTSKALCNKFLQGFYDFQLFCGVNMIKNSTDCSNAKPSKQCDNANNILLAGDAVASHALRWATKRVCAVDLLIEDVVNSSGIIADAASYHLASGGNKFRPLFLLAIASALKVQEQVAVQTAAACELLHNASLVHDDLQDKDETRRGRPAVWQRFGPEIAINLGDYFIASAFSLLASIDCHHRLRVGLTDLFAETTRIVIDGQSKE
jgi:geranylgeranyl pyrophosphate synthase